MNEQSTQRRIVSARVAISGRRKAETVVRLLGGEDAHELAESLGVSPAELEIWRREFIVSGERRMGELPIGFFERCFSPFERIVPLATIISVAIGVILFVQGRHRDAEARERELVRLREQQVTESFNALDAKYIEYVKLCLQRPDLDVFDTPLQRAAAPTAAQKREEAMMFSILISVLEHSYLMYRDQTDPFKQEQWTGWEAYIKSWLKRQNFVDEWQRTKKEFDPSFVKYVDGLIPRGPTTSKTLHSP